MTKRVFITGCARSGTTLINRLFYAFDGVSVVDPEICIDEFCELRADECKVIVAKRTPLTILSVPLPEEELLRQVKLVRLHSLSLVNVIRDGRDVVHRNPSGPLADLNRWIGCMIHAQRFRSLLEAQVRYEELVTSPDAVQTALAEALGLSPRAAFSEYPGFVPAHVFDEPEYRDYPYYDSRPIDRKSVGHSATEYMGLCTSERERGLFERALARYGYLGGSDRLEVWPQDVLERELALFRELSRELGYNCS